MSNNKILILVLVIVLYFLGLMHGYCLWHPIKAPIESGDVISGDTILYTTENVDVRVAPNMEAEIKTILPKGSNIIQVLPKDSLWEVVRISGDASGEYYIYKAFLTDTLTQESGDSGDTFLSGEQEVIQEEKNEEVETKRVSTSTTILTNKNETISRHQEVRATEPAETDELYGYFTITYYCACSKCCGPYATGITASGTKVQAGRTIAASNKYPFGTQMKIFDHIYTVEDRGGAITGNKIDIYVDSHSEALKLGRRTNVPVYKVN